MNSDGLGSGGSGRQNILRGEGRTHLHPTEAHSLQCGVVLVLPVCSAIFQVEVGWLCRRRGLYSGPGLALALRFQLCMSGLACAAGLASHLGQGVERPRLGSSEKSQGLSRLLGWPLGSWGPFSMASKVKEPYILPSSPSSLPYGRLLEENRCS